MKNFSEALAGDVSSCRRPATFQAERRRRGLGDFFEHVAKIRRVIVTAARRDIVELEIVATQQMFRAVHADVRQVIAERHLAVRLKQAREMVG
jgi:hypothetical protein